MLMIGTGELAQALYEVWREQEIAVTDGTSTPHEWPYLREQRKQQWRRIAVVAGRKLGDALTANDDAWRETFAMRSEGR